MFVNISYFWHAKNKINADPIVNFVVIFDVENILFLFLFFFLIRIPRLSLWQNGISCGWQKQKQTNKQTKTKTKNCPFILMGFTPSLTNANLFNS